MRPLRVWILQTGEPLPTDVGNPRPMRAMNLATSLASAGHRVVLWSSDFYHQEKRHRTGRSGMIRVSESLEIRLVGSPGYGPNIGPGRLYDHAVLGRNLKKLLRAEVDLPDVAFVGYPPIETAAVMTRWLSRRGIPSVMDVKDQWPTLFFDPLPRGVRPLGRAALAPYFYFARRAMREATGLAAMADGFLEWALNFAGRSLSDNDMVVPLTSPPEQLSEAELANAESWWDEHGVPADGRPRFCFVGTHSRAFDFAPVADAVRHMSTQQPHCQFVFAGHGERTQEWRANAGLAPNTLFPGWIDRARLSVLARRSTAMLAPYKSSSDFISSIPNKVIDALSLGLPILSPLQGEVAKLIEVNSVGLRYGSDTGRTLADCLQLLIDNPSLRNRLAANASATYRARFAFEKVYGGLVSHLEQLAARSQVRV